MLLLALLALSVLTSARHLRARLGRVTVASVVVLVALSDLALLAGTIEGLLGVSHLEPDLHAMRAPPRWPHLLGTDELGRDLFTRLLFGARISLTVGVVASLSSAFIGVVVGVVAGYYRGALDAVLMRGTDAMIALPVLPLMILLAALDFAAIDEGVHWWWPFAAAGGAALVVFILRLPGGMRAALPSSVTAGAALAFIGAVLVLALKVFLPAESEIASVVRIVVIIAFFGWMSVARLARAATLQLRELDFVAALISLGASDARILLRHIVPNALPPVLVALTLEVGGNILYEAALSFLGLGVQAPVPSWGNMLDNARELIKSEPMLALWPGLAIVVTATCFNFFGDGLRDVLDPQHVFKERRP